MKKTLLFVMLISASAMFGCSGGGDEGSANINNDVQTGTPPAGLDGAAPTGQVPPPAGGGEASGGGMSTPTSTP